MKKVYFFFSILLCSFVSIAQTQMNVPVTFDDPTVNYGLVGFGGAEQATVVTDPTLATNKVGKVIKTNTAELWAGASVTALAGTVQTSFANPIPFTATERRMNVRVWSPHAGISIKLKVEDKNDPTKSCETDVNLTVANAWQTLEFNFNNQSSGTAAFNPAFTFNKVSIFFNFGVTGAVAGERIYYFDDVKFGAASGGGGTSTLPILPLDFESSTLNYAFTDFAGGATTKIANPQISGINTSANVAKMIKSVGELYGGSFISLASPIDFSVNKTFKVKVFSPRVGAKLLLKVENNSDASINFEKEATSTVANAWEDLTFDYSAISTTNSYQKLIFIFDLGTMGNGTSNFTWLFDDVRLTTSGGGGTLSQMNIPVTFDDITVNYGLVGFGGAEQSTIVTDPTLATNKVAKVIKTATAELWAGTSITALAGTVQTSFANAIPFVAGSTKMNIRVWSPHANIPVRLKVEDKNDPTKSCETEAIVTTANGWQTLEFNFANQVAGTAAMNFTFSYNKASIFFNFGTTGATAGERIYYFDDVKFGAATVTPPSLSQMNIPVTFDDATVNYGLVGFGGAEDATVVTDPTLTTNKVGRVVKSNTAELWAGVSVTALAGTVQTSFANAIPFTATERRMNVRVWSPHTNIQIRLKVEDKNDGTKSCETEATFTGAANTWQALEFNFNNQATGTAVFNPAFTFNKATIFFNFGVTGAIAGARTYYFDDVKFGAATVTPPSLTQMNIPVTFDDATVNYGLVGFGGAEQSTIVTDPTLATNKVAKVIKTATAELWAGTSITALAGTVQTSFANAIPFTATEKRMNVRIWSPHAGIQVRLKVEDKNDPTKSCETEATVTTANGWQTLTFNFANQAAGTAALNLAYSFNKASIFFNFGVTGAIAGERIYYFDDVKFGGVTVPPTPTAPTVISPTNFCQNSTASLTASTTASAGNTLLWYTVATGGTGSATAPVISTTITSTATYYVSQINSSSIEGPRVAIIVNVNPTPIAPTVASPITYCQNATAVILSATAESGNILKWYSSLTGTGSSTAITPSTSTAGTTNYYVSQANSFACESPKATIAVVTNPTPTAPTISALNYCQNITAPALTATTAAGNTVRWYTAATGGTSTPIAPTPSTTTVGTTNYYVSQSNASGCESPRAMLSVTIKTSPAAPSVVSPLVYCINATSTILSATADAGNNLLWYNTATGGIGSVNIPTTVTSVSGTTTYYVSQSNVGGCESPRANIDVNIIALPIVDAISAKPYTRLYPGLTTSISVANAPAAGNTYSWYRNGILLAGQTGNNVNANIDALGNYTLKVTNINGCIGTSNVVIISDSTQDKMFVYPNPSSGKFQVRYFSNTTDLKPRKMMIVDAAGRTIYKASFVMFAAYTAMDVNLSSVSDGIYFIKLMDNDGKLLLTQKVLINK